MESTTFFLQNIDLFKQKALTWATQFATLCCLDSNHYAHKQYASYEFLLAVDALDEVQSSPLVNSFELLEKWRSGKQAWQFGFLSYDLKNEIEKLSSSNADFIQLPLLYFFEPRYVISIKEDKVTFNRNYPESFALFEQINKIEIAVMPSHTKVELKSRFTKKDYIDTVNSIKDHIRNGDVYEMNLCRELYAEDAELSMLDVYFMLNEKAKAPFTSFFKYKDISLACASPERYLKKLGNKIISQPIKGTIKRSKVYEEDEFLKSELYFSEKERAENVMIVDLVRNDLTKFAEAGSIKVEELFGVHSFKTVHHLISTVTAQLKEEKDTINCIKASFPMGSMTGAPKIKAMELIEQYEKSKRGLFSGAVGYFSPENNFDFNVVIRSVLYNETQRYLSIQSGGAITIDSDPESEWEELNLKSQVLQSILNH